jgi:two-component system chemotaxis response regulator CheY
MIGKTLRLAQVPVGTLFEAANGKEALDVMQDEWIDLVLADINMPVMTGVEMIERMNAQPETRDIPVIVVSTEGASERVSALMQQGVTAWVRKPFTPEEIRDVIETLTSTWTEDTGHIDELDSVMDSVLETFAFAFPENCEVSELPAPGEELMYASVKFSGAASGSMMIAAPNDLCAELAANILGTAPGDSDSLMRGADTLGEVLNIAVGHVATCVDASAPTDIEPPVVQRMSVAEWEELRTDPLTRGYLVEDRPVLVSLTLRNHRSC